MPILRSLACGEFSKPLGGRVQSIAVDTFGVDRVDRMSEHRRLRHGMQLAAGEKWLYRPPPKIAGPADPDDVVKREGPEPDEEPRVPEPWKAHAVVGRELLAPIDVHVIGVRHL